ncbi:MAG: hypothetical protein KF842_05655 [Caulobacter sp.]|nr:hypothetical protein [Caulobacter sp.]
MKTLPLLAAALAMLAAVPAHAQSVSESEKDLMEAYDGCKRIQNGATEVIFTYMGYTQVPNVGLVKQTPDHAVAVNLVERRDQNGRMEHQCISMLAPATATDSLLGAIRADARARGYVEQPQKAGSDGISTMNAFVNTGSVAFINLIATPAGGDRNFPMVSLSNVWTSQ